MELHEWIFVVLLGLSFGSFANVLIFRTPNDLSVVRPRSFCPICENQIKALHNIPLLSYIFLGGKCAHCGEKISIVYPLVELLTTILFLLLFIKSGFFISTLFVSVVFMLLLALSVIDIHYKEVADSITLSALVVAVFSGVPDLARVVINFENALLLAGGFALLRFYVSFLLKKEAMGEGDIIVAGIIGALLGVKLSIAAIFIASCLAIPITLALRSYTHQIPFIPFLSLGTLIATLFNKEILRFFGQ